MRRVVLASALLMAVPLLVVPTASAAPASPALCAPDVSRGEVPSAFPVAACVDGASITLHNDRDRPVVVSGSGNFGTRAMLQTQGNALADVVRRTSPSALVLLPGEVARWPIGPGSVDLTVAPLPVPSAPEIADILERALAGEGPQALHDSAGALIGTVAEAARARAACVEGRSFLGAAACDVTAAAAIGSATADRLDRVTAGEVLPRLLDPAAWAEWPLVDPDWPADAEPTLRQQAAVPPAPAPPVPQEPAVTGGIGDTAPAAAAPRTPVARPTPSPAPTRAPASPPVRTTPAPAPVPAPVPALPPVPVLVPALPPQPHVDLPSWQEIHDRNMARLRELAEAWAKAREQDRERDRDGDRGRGHR